MPVINGSKLKEEDTLQEEKTIEYKEKDGKRYRVVLEENDNGHIKSFLNTFNEGIKGNNIILSTGLPKLDKYIQIRKKQAYLIGAATGCGKTTFCDETFVFNPCEWFIENSPDIDFKILYWSMERSLDEKIARWISKRIFYKYQILIPPSEILSREIGLKLSRDKEVIIRKEVALIEEIMNKVLIIHSGATNPTDVYKKIKEFAEARGIKETIIIRQKNGYEYFKTIYIPNNPKEFVLLIADPVNRTRREKGQEKKEAIDKLSEHFLDARDLYGYSTIETSQFNRSISNPIRLQNENWAVPSLEDFKETGNLAEDSEVVIALFDPMTYKVGDIYGYDLTKLKEGKDNKMPGSFKYRQLHILKNSYGAKDVGLGLAFQPSCGIFSELPYNNEMNDDIYNSILNDTYFLKNRPQW